jgi:hypothetical protein
VELINLIDYTVWYALAIVVAAIVLDALLAVMNTFKPDTDNFDFRKLPQFVATNIFPYVGGLTLVATLANVIGDPYSALFYPIAAAVLLKYLTDIKDKLSILFGISLPD